MLPTTWRANTWARSAGTDNGIVAVTSLRGHEQHYHRFNLANYTPAASAHGTRDTASCIKLQISPETGREGCTSAPRQTASLGQQRR
jgi:hypothetical protein